MRLGYLIKIAVTLVGLAVLGSLVLVYRWNLGAAAALEIAALALGSVVFISLFIAGNWLVEERVKSIVQRWAKTHHYHVVEFENPSHTGAFGFWTTSRSQVVYSVTVRDEAGCERKAWVRCGSYLGGVLTSDAIEVKWQVTAESA